MYALKDEGRSYGGFALPVSGGRLLLARRDDKEGIPYPGYWNCLGGGASPQEASPTEVVAREFREESLCELASITGRVGRPLVLLRKTGDTCAVDVAEAFLVEFTGTPKLTEETRELKWFDYQALKDEQKIVGRDVSPFGRTMMFALWGVSIAARPAFIGDAEPKLIEALGISGVSSPETRLSRDERYLVRISNDEMRIWHNLSLNPEADELGILPGGALGALLGN